jgi:hypothetical protein
MVKFRFLIFLSMAVIICGCATEQLQNSTVSVSASATDIYYQMVLQNLARAYEEPDGLPWGVELTTGSIQVNDTEQLTGGYSETWPMVTPTAGIQSQRVVQQSWGTAPVTNLSALMALKGYYTDVVKYAEYVEYQKDANHLKNRENLLYFTKLTNLTLPPNPQYPSPTQDGIIIPSRQISLSENPSVSTTAQTVNYLTNAITNPVLPVAPPTLPSQQAAPVPAKYPGGKEFDYGTVTKTSTSNAPNVNLKGIDISCFNFTSGLVPSNSISGKYGNTVVYVKLDKKNMDNFTRFTILIVNTIDQVAPKASGGVNSIGAQPQPLLQ